MAPSDRPEVLLPTPRQVSIARLYVEGLERDRERLLKAEEDLVRTTWEAIQLGSYNRALHVTLYQILQGMETGRISQDLLDRAYDLLAANQPIKAEVWMCACGHSKYDHDENGCMFLGCDPICGAES